MKREDLLRDPWATGRWCWVVDDVQRLRRPVPLRGSLGLWRLPPSVDAFLHLGDDAPTHALTVLQPFASAIIDGPKRVENRDWRFKVPAGGRWIGVHAGKEWWSHAEAAGGRCAADLIEEWADRPDPLWPQQGIWPEARNYYPTNMGLGVLIGAMHVDQILEYPRG